MVPVLPEFQRSEVRDAGVVRQGEVVTPVGSGGS
jgi:hypothetical protein